MPAYTVADPSSASLFGSIDSRGKVVAIALNLSPSAVLNMSVGTTGCPAATKLRHLTYDGTKSGFVPEPGSGATAKSVTLRPWTINVLEWS